VVGDAAIARLAAVQHRVVSLEQLQAAQLGPSAVRHRLANGRLQRLWRGVFLVGPGAPNSLSLAMGAVLATGGNGVLSLRWAAWLWGFLETVRRPVDVTVVSGSRRGRPGILVHRAGALDTTRKRGIPVTSPAQTCLDLAAVVEPGELERIIAEAQVKNVLRESHLHDVIARNPRRPGVAVLKAILADGPQYTAAESERRMLSLARMADLPRPETNARVLRYRADFRWRDQKLIVEIDGFATHGHRRAFENDRRRNAALVAAGYRVMQITWRQLTDEPIAVAARIAAALARGDAA
jgi:very-short-patch-repair endonuclease